MKCYLVEPEVPGGSRAGVPVQVRRCDSQHLVLVHPGTPDKFLPFLISLRHRGIYYAKNYVWEIAAREKLTREGRKKEKIASKNLLNALTRIFLFAGGGPSPSAVMNT